MRSGLSKLLMILYDSLTGRNTLQCRKSLEKTQWMKKKDIHRLQLRRLKRLLKHARAQLVKSIPLAKSGKIKHAVLKIATKYT